MRFGGSWSCGQPGLLAMSRNLLEDWRQVLEIVNDKWTLGTICSAGNYNCTPRQVPISQKEQARMASYVQYRSIIFKIFQAWRVAEHIMCLLDDSVFRLVAEYFRWFLVVAFLGRINWNPITLLFRNCIFPMSFPQFSTRSLDFSVQLHPSPLSSHEFSGGPFESNMDWNHRWTDSKASCLLVKDCCCLTSHSAIISLWDPAVPKPPKNITPPKVMTKNGWFHNDSYGFRNVSNIFKRNS